MELKVSSLKRGGLSPSDCTSDPEEKEVSDEDDDDRNHKHRRRETRSQSLERDSLEPIFTRSYKKRSKPFENGHLFRENESQGSETWKNYNTAPLEKEFNSKFEKRRPGMSSLPRVAMDLNQRIRTNQTFPGEHGLGRGRGRDPVPWNQRDSRFSSVDIASQMVQPGSITPNIFAGRGMANVSNSQNPSWNAFGLIPGLPNGGLEAIHPIGLQGPLRPAVNSSLNMGISRQRCRDFEERGFCLRGDMCPMEHGVNRIVVEDVQSLSQFNLPVSLPSGALVPAAPGTLPSVGASSNTLMNSKGLHNRISKTGIVDDVMGLNGAYSGSASVSGADLYDPDQPLWNNNCPEKSNALLGLHSSNNDETEPFMGVDNSDRRHVRLYDGTDSENAIRGTGISVGSQSTSVWGRVGCVKNGLDMKEKTELTVNNCDYLQSESKEEHDVLGNAQSTSRQGKRIISEDIRPKIMDPTAKIQSDTMRNARKSSQKAHRTLFVSGIPQKSNRRDTLLSHFHKFGEVIDIYIPSNSERAFVQFSKREEAEAALRAPDAVMGNRFIKLWWANRDSIPDDSINSNTSASLTPHGGSSSSVPPQTSLVNKGKDNLQTASKGITVSSSGISLPPTNAPKVPPPLQKKLEIEQLREELRKKRDLLDQKRIDFQRELEKLEKAKGVKGELVAEPAPKKHKLGLALDVSKASTTPRSFDPAAGVPSPRVEMTADKNKPVESALSSSPETSISLTQHESAGLKQPIHQVATPGPSFRMNRYKLDGRPTAFRIAPPVPIGLANVDTLKKHFSSYGELSTVELEDGEASNDGDGSKVPKHCSALVAFTSRRSAEKAFLNGKCWQGNNLQFTWVAYSASGSDLSGQESIQSASKYPVYTDIQPSEKLAGTDSQEASASGNSEPETSERDANVDEVELHETGPISTLGEHSPKCEEGSPKREHSPTSASGEAISC